MGMKKKQHQLPIVELSSASLFTLPEVFRQFTVFEKKEIDIIKNAKKFDNHFLISFASKNKEKYACLVEIINNINFKENKHKVILKGIARCKVTAIEQVDNLSLAKFELAQASELSGNEITAIRRSINRHLLDYAKFGPLDISHAMIKTYQDMTKITNSIDYLALNLVSNRDNSICGSLIEAVEIKDRALVLLSYLHRFIEENKIESIIRKRVKSQMEKTHKEFHLTEEAKAVQEELQSEGTSDIDILRANAKKANLPKYAQEKCDAELKKLANIPPISPETSVIKTYVETLISLPWNSRSAEKINIKQAKEILDQDHYGLEKIKDRILEYLVIQKRKGKPNGPILCFVGPPGVGKTSLGKSIAKATGREFIRISLGGVHEEAAIRGHRKTYVAAMPGRIIKAMAKVKVKNPVFVLDEFDKIVSGYNFYGDPAAALLEVLDPEQNKKFIDQYLEIDFDLSEVMFITTANQINHLPSALADRLEIIHLAGYTDEEKLVIAKKHLIKKQIANHGLADNKVKFSDNIIKKIIQDYTHEAGVRDLDRNIARICRKIATEKVMAKKIKKIESITVTNQRINELLEVPEYYSTFNLPQANKVGYANGLIYGLGVIPMEVVTFKSKEEDIEITGITEGTEQINSLCEVSLTLLKSRHKPLGLQENFANERTIHIHLQESAFVPYGSLGVSIYTVLVSVFTNIAIRSATAFLGEINLRGDVISSELFNQYKATVMDAQRKRIKRIIMPHEDAQLLEDLPQELKENIEFILVSNVNEVIKHALVSQPKPLTKAEITLPIETTISPETKKSVTH